MAKIYPNHERMSLDELRRNVASFKRYIIDPDGMFDFADDEIAEFLDILESLIINVAKREAERDTGELTNAEAFAYLKERDGNYEAQAPYRHGLYSLAYDPNTNIAALIFGCYESDGNSVKWVTTVEFAGDESEMLEYLNDMMPHMWWRVYQQGTRFIMRN
jgi:hypothetical protein